LKITGTKDLIFGTGFYYVDATLISAQPNIFRKISFAVDTGCAVTTVSVKDWLPFSDVVPPASNSGVGVGGPVLISSLSNCGIIFDLVQSRIIEMLTRVNFLRPNLTVENLDYVMLNPSLLGMDILSRYYVSFDSNLVTLEK
jgi:hypothetical protein